VATELPGQVKYGLDFVGLEDPLELAILGYVRSHKGVCLDLGMAKVATEYGVATGAKFID
jgi:hypothetical protein